MNEVGTRAIERPTDFTFPDQEAASPPILFLSLFSRQGKVKENRERRRERHRGVKKSDPRICNREGGRGGRRRRGLLSRPSQISTSPSILFLLLPVTHFLETRFLSEFFSPILLLQSSRIIETMLSIHDFSFG